MDLGGGVGGGGDIEGTWQEGIQFFLRTCFYFWTSVTSSLPAGGLGHREFLTFHVSHVPRPLQVLVAVMVSGGWWARKGGH